MQKKYLISGLGNIGETYKNTRHNIGFKIVEKLAEKLNAPFKKKDKLKGLIAEGNLNDHKIYLLKPTTYMNESGQAVLAVKKFYKKRKTVAFDDSAKSPMHRRGGNICLF